MNRIYGIITALVIVLLTASCTQKKSSVTQLKNENDSLAYVMGMHVGRNLMAMDSTLNVEALCRGIRETFRQKTLLSDDEARIFYLRFVNYTLPERAKAYEEQFLNDFRRENRSYARTKSGLTYSVEVVGNETKIPRNDNDTITIRYVAKHQDGRVFHSSYEQGDSLRITLRQMRNGVKEAIRLTSEGGKIHAWVPAELAYGLEGDKQVGIAPNETLFYEIELLEVKQGNRYKRSTTGNEKVI